MAIDPKNTGRGARKRAARTAVAGDAGAGGSKTGAGAASPDDAPPSPNAPAGSGVTIMQDVAAFNADAVTAQSGEVLGAIDGSVAEQAAAMMMGDLRTYLQGSEQIVLAASAQAMKLLLDPATQETGTAALKALSTWQGDLTTYASNLVEQANTIRTDFSS